MARICVLLLVLVLVSAISLSGVLAKDITAVKLGDADNSLSHLTNSEEIIVRERRTADVADRKARKKARRRARGKVEKKKANKAGKKRRQRQRQRNRSQDKKEKKKKKSLKKRKQKQSCSSEEVSLSCMKNALDCMLFEKNQVTNWLKQAKRLENHGTISTNKVGKKGNFEAARKHLEWAIGGNKSSPQCGPNTTSGRAALTGLHGETIDFDKEQVHALGNLTLMENCSVSIEAACNTDKLDVNLTEFSEVLSTCRSFMTEFIDKRKSCAEMTDSTSTQCSCWSELSVLMANIKAFNCKRIKETQKILTKHKTACISVFSECKKSEDHSVGAVYKCMEDHSMGFINQTLDTLADAATDGAKLENRFLAEFGFLSD